MANNRNYRNIDQNDYLGFKDLICNNCQNYIDFAECKAFPYGIPKDILKGNFDHHKPYPGDHGIRFEAKKE
jgi:hypothetical protein